MAVALIEAITAMSHVLRPATTTVENLLQDLASRGLLRAHAAGTRPPHAGPLPLTEIEPRLTESPFVSVCGLANLTVLNRLYGPGLGDLAAEMLGAVVVAVTGESDAAARVARTHGHDILVLHASPERELARALAERLRDTLAAVALPVGGGVVHLHPFVATLETHPSWRGSKDELVRTLHEARALAQKSDDRIVLLDAQEAAETLAHLRSRDARLASVTEALEQGRVEVHYQPVVNLRTGELEDVEALARIRTPEGLLTASEFIDDLHLMGETAALDTQVMRRVGENAPALGRATGRFFLNVSPLSLGDPAFRAQMDATLTRLRAEGLQLILVLELTEQALVEHYDVIRDVHRHHGVTFAVDDFGTGYSSLRTVADLAVSRVISFLKLDGSLTRRIAESTENYRVVLAIAHLAKSLDLRVIAEHVETPEVLERLRTTGIECGQGFLFDPPLSPDELVVRHERGARSYLSPPSRPHLRLLEPYLHRAFEVFYERLLSDPHFARFFHDAAQVRRLVETQKQFFIESLDEDDATLRERYVRLGRRHAELGLPLETFLKGADILHDQLLDLLVHATREAQVLRDTGRLFASLRDPMARGYVERLLPEAQGDLEGLRTWASRALPVPPEVHGSLFAFMEGVIDEVTGSLEGIMGIARRDAPVAIDDGAAAWIEAAGLSSAYHALLSDADSLHYFLARREYAATHAILEGLLGRFRRLVLALAAGPGRPHAGRV